jgi:T5SS/PEP-CTERM-associated repeat protein
MGRLSNATGLYTISGGALTVGNNAVVGQISPGNGVGTMTIQNTGSVYVTNNLIIDSASAVNVNGGTLRINNVGGSGGLSRINYTAGTIQLAGSRTFETDVTIKTLFGFATPTIPGGKSLVIEDSAYIGDDGNVQLVRVNGGSLIVDGVGTELVVGGPCICSGGNGMLEITDGGVVQGGVTLYVGFYSNGSVTVSGPGSTLTAIAMAVGANANGELNVRDGAVRHQSFERRQSRRRHHSVGRLRAHKQRHLQFYLRHCSILWQPQYRKRRGHH